jgi:hypothetical protein
MARKSHETIGPNVYIPATTESNVLQYERLQGGHRFHEHHHFPRSTRLNYGFSRFKTALCNTADFLPVYTQHTRKKGKIALETNH